MTPFSFGGELFGMWNWLDAVVRVVIVVTAMTLVVMYLTYGERKVVARFQQRLGPTKTGPAGLFQAFADALKLVAKEDIRPTNADRWVFELAPYATFVPVFLVLLVLPFAKDWGVRNLTLGMFFVFAVLGLNIVGIIMAGLGSGNKFALLGGVRAAAQMISYEIPLVLSLLAVAMVAGTLDLNQIAMLQEDRPFIVLQPLAFLIFFTAMLSEMHRAPFDIPVAESEIVGGYFVEYSGIRWGMFFLAEFIEIVFISSVICVVFFGGYQVPFLDEDGFRFFGAVTPLPHWAVVAMQLGAFATKVFLLCWFQLLIRWTLPRFRADQLMNLGWKLLLPASLAWIMITALGKLILMSAGG